MSVSATASSVTGASELAGGGTDDSAPEVLAWRVEFSRMNERHETGPRRKPIMRKVEEELDATGGCMLNWDLSFYHASESTFESDKVLLSAIALYLLD